jgi:hypothetical protein
MSEGIWTFDPFRNEIVNLICDAFGELAKESNIEQAIQPLLARQPFLVSVLPRLYAKLLR